MELSEASNTPEVEHDHIEHLSEEIQNACMALPLYRFTEEGHEHENHAHEHEPETTTM